MDGHLSLMPLQSDADLATLLRETKTIALKIASPKPHRYSNKVLKFLVEYGYDVYPINPGHAGEKIAGRAVYADLNQVPVAIDLVDIFRRSEDVAPIVSKAIEIGARAIWMQLGIINDAAAAEAETAGLKVVMDRCPAIDIPRLRRLGFM